MDEKTPQRSLVHAFVATSRSPILLDAATNRIVATKATLPYTLGVDLPAGCISTIHGFHGGGLGQFVSPPDGTMWSRLDFEVHRFPNALVTSGELARSSMIVAGRLSRPVTEMLDRWVDRVIREIAPPSLPRSLQPPSMPMWMRYPALIPALLDCPEFGHVAAVKLPVRLQNTNHSLTTLIFLLKPSAIRGVTCTSRPDMTVTVPLSFTQIDARRAQSLKIGTFDV